MTQEETKHNDERKLMSIRLDAGKKEVRTRIGIMQRTGWDSSRMGGVPFELALLGPVHVGPRR